MKLHHAILPLLCLPITLLPAAQASEQPNKKQKVDTVITAPAKSLSDVYVGKMLAVVHKKLADIPMAEAAGDVCARANIEEIGNNKIFKPLLSGGVNRGAVARSLIFEGALAASLPIPSLRMMWCVLAQSFKPTDDASTFVAMVPREYKKTALWFLGNLSRRIDTRDFRVNGLMQIIPNLPKDVSRLIVGYAFANGKGICWGDAPRITNMEFGEGNFSRLGIDTLATGQINMQALKAVDLSGNFLTELWEKDQKSFPENCHTLNLAQNDIAVLKPLALGKSYKLTSLNLSGNKIECLPRHCFAYDRFNKDDRSIFTITVLDLSNNEIREISQGVLPRLLQVLNLSNNKLVAVPDDIRHGLKELQDLDIRDNELDWHAQMELWVSRKHEPQMKRLLVGPGRQMDKSSESSN